MQEKKMKEDSYKFEKGCFYIGNKKIGEIKSMELNIDTITPEQGFRPKSKYEASFILKSMKPRYTVTIEMRESLWARIKRMFT